MSTGTGTTRAAMLLCYLLLVIIVVELIAGGWLGLIGFFGWVRQLLVR